MRTFKVALSLSAIFVLSASSYEYSVVNGWNLLGATEDIADFSSFEDSGTKIWKFRENSWTIIDFDAPKEGIDKGEGFWFYATKSGVIADFSSSSSSSTSSSSSSTSSSISSSSSSSTVAYKIVDTAQSECFGTTGATASCTNSKQDGEYMGNSMSYTKNGDIVVDNVTGLIWQQSGDINSDGTIDIDDKLSQSEAASYCQSLSLGGYDDWRLPDIKTLYSLMHFGGEDISVDMSGDYSGAKPFIDDSYFDFGYGDESAGERSIDSQWATTSIYVDKVMNSSECMFGLNLADGRIKCYPTSNKEYYVKCVRGSSEYGVNSFVDNNDNTISDKATNLMWTKEDSGEGLLFDSAISYCENLSLAGYDNWRTPNAKELHSLLDYSRSPGTTSSAAIDPIFSSTQIVNEKGENDFGWYWSNTTHKSSNGDGSAGVYVSFGRALGYFQNQWMDVHGAGAQRSDPKDISSIKVDGVGYQNATTHSGGSAIIHGPQGDVVRGSNFVRCVRDVE